MNYTVLLTITTLISMISIAGNAQEKNKTSKHEIQLTAGLNSNLALEFDPSYSYMFHENIGITVGMRCIQEVTDNLHYDVASSQRYEWRINDRKKVSNFLFRPAIRLQFPIAEAISFVAEPGILLNIIPNEKLEFAYINTKDFEPTPQRYKTIKNKDGEILSYDLKSYVSARIDNIAILVGYNISTFDIYSGRRNMIIENEPLNKHLPDEKKFIHTGFIGASYFF